MIPACEHHTQGDRPPCSEGGGTPKCSKSCESDYTVPYQQDLHYGLTFYCIVFTAKFLLFFNSFVSCVSGASSYSVHKRVEDIQLEIMNNGPVEGALTVYEDFPTYKSGIHALNWAWFNKTK